MASPDLTNSYVTEKLTQAFSECTILTDKAAAALADAITASQSYFRSGPIDKVIKPNIYIPNWIPDIDLAKLFETDYNNLLKGFQDNFLPLFDTFTKKFYPGLNKGLIDASDKWLLDTINNGGLGLPEKVEQAHFQRARDREYEAALVVKDSAVNEFAARGHDLPSGALASRFQQADLESQKKIAEDNRAWTIELYKIRLETLKFAIKEVVELRKHANLLIKDMVMDYLKLGNLAAEIAKDKSQAYQALWNATAEYYRSITTVQSLLIDVDKFNIDMNFKHQTLDFQSFEVSLKSRTQAAITVGQLYSQAASAYVSAQNTLVHLSSTSATQN